MLSGKPASQITLISALTIGTGADCCLRLGIGRDSVHTTGDTSCVILLIPDTSAALDASLRVFQNSSKIDHTSL